MFKIKIEKLLFVLFFIFSIIFMNSKDSFAQDITGKWNGILKVQNIELRIIFNIEKNGNTYKSTMDSPDQGVKGIPVTSISFENSKINISIKNFGIEYEGVLDKNIIIGNFKQASQSFPVNLSKEEIKEVNKIIRPQDPVKPYPYYQEDVFFDNKKDNIKLAGTLTLPSKEGVFTSVVLITGSGPQNRDQEILGHKTFLVLSDFLTRNGIAVLRFDDRGVGSSTGNFSTATSFDFSKDVESAVEYLKTRKEIDKNKIGLIGHSEGGLIAPMVENRTKDIAFIILLAGPGISGEKILLSQQEIISIKSGVDSNTLDKNKRINKGLFEIVKKSKENQNINEELYKFLKNKDFILSEDEIKTIIQQIDNPWMRYFIKYDLNTILEKIKCPVLAINGKNDLQVLPKENLEAIKKAVLKGGNKKVTVKELSGLNHLFQESTTGLPSEYAEISETFSPKALNEILNWIKEEIK